MRKLLIESANSTHLDLQIHSIRCVSCERQEKLKGGHMGEEEKCSLLKPGYVLDPRNYRDQVLLAPMYQTEF
jgi:hypothetical protein